MVSVGGVEEEVEGTSAVVESAAGASEEPGMWVLQPVCLAFQLGWDMARLYAVAVRRKPFEYQPGWKLPSQREFKGPLHGLDTERRLVSVSCGLQRMDEALAAAGINRPLARTLIDRYVGGAEKEGLRDAIYRLHVATLISMQAADPRLGSAYNLGRALCDTGIDSSRPLEKRFEYHRVNGLRGELSALAASFPPHSARAVSRSLCIWRCVLGRRRPAKQRDDFQGAMPRQADIWRALLAGERRGSDLLVTGDYMAAGKRATEQAGSVVSEVARSYRTGLLIAAGIVAIGVAIAIVFSGAGGTVAGIGVAASALGVSWKGIATTVTALADRLRAPLWGAELDRAIGDAATLIEGRNAYAELPEAAQQCNSH